MKRFVRIGSCQTPEIIGDPDTVLACMMGFTQKAEAQEVDLLLFPECFLSGYTTDREYLEDFAYDFDSEAFARVLGRLQHVGPTLVFGVSEKKSGKYYNSAVVVTGGKIVGVYRKTHLIDPGEALFAAGSEYPIFEIKGLKYGINICYDAQFGEAAQAVARQGAQLLLLPAQNMMRRESAEKWKYRHNEIRSERVRETGMWLVSSDVTGMRPKDEQGIERIGYGPTLAMNPKAEAVAQVPLMTEGMIIVDIPAEG